MTKIVLDAEAFRALSSDTRLQILKALDARPLTVSEMGRLLGLNKATVFEHLKQLSTADLVKKQEDEGRKWVYYKLTWKGRNVVHPENAQFMLLLGTAALSVGGAVAALGNALRWWRFFGNESELLAPQPSPQTSPALEPMFQDADQASAGGPAPTPAPAGDAPERAASPTPSGSEATGAPDLREESSGGDGTAWFANPDYWLLGLVILVVLLSAFLAWQFVRGRRQERGAVRRRLDQLPSDVNADEATA